MCVNCQAPSKHFTDGQKDRSRELPSSVKLGYSPDWGGRTSSTGSGDGDKDKD